MKRLWYYFFYLLLVWGSFRYWAQLPEALEELWFKPMVWLVPLFWWNLSLKGRIVILGKEWIPSMTLGLFIGLIYFIFLRRFDLSNIEWSLDKLGIVIATAITEELVFSGFVIGYMEKFGRSRVRSLLIVSLMVMMIRLPILIFIYKPGWLEVAGILLLSGAMAAINAWIRMETGNVLGSVVARVGMNLAILR